MSEVQVLTTRFGSPDLTRFDSLEEAMGRPPVAFADIGLGSPVAIVEGDRIVRIFRDYPDGSYLWAEPGEILEEVKEIEFLLGVVRLKSLDAERLGTRRARQGKATTFNVESHETREQVFEALLGTAAEETMGDSSEFVATWRKRFTEAS